MVVLHLTEKANTGRTEGIGKHLQWEYEDGTIRDAQEIRTDYIYPGPFTVAGRAYSSWMELCAEEIHKCGYSSICRDIYGREIFVQLREFPQRYSFDDLSWLGNERFYREFYIRQEDKICRVFYEDKQNNIRVFEDTQYIYNTTINKMIDLHWIE